MQTRGKQRSFDRHLVALEALIGIGVVTAILGSSYGPAPTVTFVLASLALAFTAFVGFKMLASLRDPSLDVTARFRDEERDRLEEEKRLLLQGIKEIEADAAIGKVDANDYAHLRSSAERRALAIIHHLRALDARWMAEAERQVARAVPSTGTVKGTGTAATGTSIESASAGVDETEASATTPARAAVFLFDDRPVTFKISPEANDRVICEGCQASSPLNARFCTGCGRPRAPAIDKTGASLSRSSSEPEEER